MDQGSDSTPGGILVRVPVPDSAPGEGMAWKHFYEVCDPAIRAALKGRSLQQADRDDCVQEVWKAIVSSRPGVVEGEKLAAWVARVARNKAIDQARRRRGRPLVDPGVLEISDESDGEHADLDEIRAVVRRALVDLDHLVDLRSSLVFSLRWLEGWSFAEIAGELGMTPSQARLRSHRVKQAFRKRLEADRSLPDGIMPSRCNRLWPLA